MDAGGKVSQPVSGAEKPAVPKKEKPKPANPTQMCWTFGPDIPTEDFFEGRSLDNMHNLYEAVDSFIFWTCCGRPSFVKNKASRLHAGRRTS